MDTSELVSRIRVQGIAAMSEADRCAFAYRPGSGRLVRRELVDRLLGDFSEADLPWVRSAWHHLETAYGEDLFDEDSDGD